VTHESFEDVWRTLTHLIVFGGNAVVNTRINHNYWLLVFCVLFIVAAVIGCGPEVTVPATTANEETIMLPGNVPLEMVWIEPGTFMMGSKFSPQETASRFCGKAEFFEDEHPQHKVRITQGFWMGKYEVTQAQWQTVMGNNPSRFKGDRNPVESVSWNDCQEFVIKLGQKAGAAFRLPTEAEWEYACRAGSTTAYCFGDDASRLGDYAWYDDNSGKQTHPVGQKKANAWGLYDMHGNVWEWCEDWYHADFYSKSPERDPLNTSTGDNRVLRGGSWYISAGYCRSANRGRDCPTDTFSSLGFRVVCVSSR